jgi:serine protease DegQ
VSELLSSVAALRPGEATAFKLQRRDDALSLNVTPGLRPKPKAVQPQQR